MPRRIQTLEDVAAEIRHLRDRLDSLDSTIINLKGRRVTNAAPSKDPSDYVTRKEIVEAFARIGVIF